MDSIEQSCANLAAAFVGKMEQAFADDAALDLAYRKGTLNEWFSTNDGEPGGAEPEETASVDVEETGGAENPGVHTAATEDGSPIQAQ